MNVIGGKEKGNVGRSYESNKKKVVFAVELTDEGNVKRMYSMRIELLIKRVKKAICKIYPKKRR